MRAALKRRVIHRVRWGNLRRVRPISDVYGLDRGTAIDRVYIESFLRLHGGDIRGRVLEVGDSRYTQLVGGAGVDRSDVLDVDPHNTNATVLADLAVSGSLPPSVFECFILVQTLHFIPDVCGALNNATSALCPGGVLLITMPTVSRIDPTTGLGEDHWRCTPSGLELALRRCCSECDIEVSGYGNLITSIAFLHGIAAEELRREELERYDPWFPLIACARVAKPRFT